MRYSIMAIAIVSFVSSAVAADAVSKPNVTFAGENLYLAYVEDGAADGITLNEYIRNDESLEKWKVMLALRHVQTASSVEEVVNRWKAYIAQVKTPGLSLKENDGSHANDRRFTLSIRAPDDSFIETNKMRFVLSPDGKGVNFYQASVRVNPKIESEVKQGLEQQIAFEKALQSLALKPILKMPLQAPELAPAPKPIAPPVTKDSPSLPVQPKSP